MQIVSRRRIVHQPYIDWQMVAFVLYFAAVGLFVAPARLARRYPEVATLLAFVVVVLILMSGALYHVASNFDPSVAGAQGVQLTPPPLPTAVLHEVIERPVQWPYFPGG